MYKNNCTIKSNISIGTANDSVAMQMFEEYVQKYIFPQKLSIVCVLDEDNTDSPGELIGCNLLGIKRKIEVGVYNQLVKTHLYSMSTERFSNLETRFKRRRLARSEIVNTIILKKAQFLYICTHMFSFLWTIVYSIS